MHKSSGAGPRLNLEEDRNGRTRTSHPRQQWSTPANCWMEIRPQHPRMLRFHATFCTDGCMVGGEMMSEWLRGSLRVIPGLLQGPVAHQKHSGTGRRTETDRGWRKPPLDLKFPTVSFPTVQDCSICLSETAVRFVRNPLCIPAKTSTLPMGHTSFNSGPFWPILMTDVKKTLTFPFIRTPDAVSRLVVEYQLLL